VQRVHPGDSESNKRLGKGIRILLPSKREPKATATRTYTYSGFGSSIGGIGGAAGPAYGSAKPERIQLLPSVVSTGSCVVARNQINQSIVHPLTRPCV
jgi:hypothetical protein